MPNISIAPLIELYTKSLENGSDMRQLTNTQTCVTFKTTDNQHYRMFWLKNSCSTVVCRRTNENGAACQVSWREVLHDIFDRLCNLTLSTRGERYSDYFNNKSFFLYRFLLKLDSKDRTLLLYCITRLSNEDGLALLALAKYNRDGLIRFIKDTKEIDALNTSFHIKIPVMTNHISIFDVIYYILYPILHLTWKIWSSIFPYSNYNGSQNTDLVSISLPRDSEWSRKKKGEDICRLANAALIMCNLLADDMAAADKFLTISSPGHCLFNELAKIANQVISLVADTMQESRVAQIVLTDFASEFFEEGEHQSNEIRSIKSFFMAIIIYRLRKLKRGNLPVESFVAFTRTTQSQDLWERVNERLIQWKQPPICDIEGIHDLWKSNNSLLIQGVITKKDKRATIHKNTNTLHHQDSRFSTVRLFNLLIGSQHQQNPPK